MGWILVLAQGLLTSKGFNLPGRLLALGCWRGTGKGPAGRAARQALPQALLRDFAFCGSGNAIRHRTGGAPRGQMTGTLLSPAQAFPEFLLCSLKGLQPLDLQAETET